MGYSGPGWGEFGTYVESQTMKPSADIFGLRSNFSAWSVRKTRWKQGRRTSFLGRAAPGCSLNVGCKLLSSHLREAAAKPVLSLWGLCCLEILRRSSPDASDTLLLGSCSQEFWHRNPVLFFVCLFCYIKVGVSGCQITGFHPNTCPIDIPDPRPLLLTSPLTPTVGYQRWKEV